MLFYHPVSEATPDSKITGAYCAPLFSDCFASKTPETLIRIKDI
jgi:hypothetical protein